MTLGQRIREARLDRGLTQQELVGECITRNMLSKIENDSATPSVRTLEYLSERLGLSPGEFLSSDLSSSEDIFSYLEKLKGIDHEKFMARLAFESQRLVSMQRRLKLLEAEACIDSGDLSKAERILDMQPPEGPESNYKFFLLKGRLCLERGRFERARQILLDAERLAPQKADLKSLYRLLETCCHNLGDYQNAYSYATRQRGEGK